MVCRSMPPSGPQDLSVMMRTRAHSLSILTVVSLNPEVVVCRGIETSGIIG